MLANIDILTIIIYYVNIPTSRYYNTLQAVLQSKALKLKVENFRH